MEQNERDLIYQKLSILQDYYRELQSLEYITFEEYTGNNINKRAVERLIQLIVEVATDINNILLKILRQKTAPDYFSTFIELAHLKVLDEDFARLIAPSTGLRNIIVHEYQIIDDKIVYNAIKTTLQFYLQYMKYINNYLKG